MPAPAPLSREHPELAEVVPRADHDRVVDAQEHRLEALVEVDPVRCRIEDAARLDVAAWRRRRSRSSAGCGRRDRRPSVRSPRRAHRESRSGTTISVVVRFALAAPPGRNSVTRPLTVTACPTVTDAADAGAEDEDRVRGGVRSVPGRVLHREAVRPHGRDDARQRRDELAVERRDVRRALDLVDPRARAPTVREREGVKSAAMVSGGSTVSTSVTPWSSTVTVHVSPTAKSVSGSSV